MLRVPSMAAFAEICATCAEIFNAMSGRLIGYMSV